MRKPYYIRKPYDPSRADADHGAYLPTLETIARECERIRERSPRQPVGFNESPVELVEVGEGVHRRGWEIGGKQT